MSCSVCSYYIVGTCMALHPIEDAFMDRSSDGCPDYEPLSEEHSTRILMGPYYWDRFGDRSLMYKLPLRVGRALYHTKVPPECIKHFKMDVYPREDNKICMHMELASNLNGRYARVLFERILSEHSPLGSAKGRLRMKAGLPYMTVDIRAGININIGVNKKAEN